MTSIPETTAITKCRVCKSDQLIDLFSIGNLYISNFPEKADDGMKAPLEMVMCDNCKLAQLRHSAPQELLYSRFYWYRSGVTDTMKKRCAISRKVLRVVWI